MDSEFDTLNVDGTNINAGNIAATNMATTSTMDYFIHQLRPEP